MIQSNLWAKVLAERQMAPRGWKSMKKEEEKGSKWEQWRKEILGHIGISYYDNYSTIYMMKRWYLLTLMMN
uniref:Ovule protein n=1 Tax=Romanomermis culicivorax TaxID=13658 RepID=A0A915K7P7_ROMCU